MYKEIVWFMIGFAFAKFTEKTDAAKKIKKMAEKCTQMVKEEFTEKRDPRHEILFRKF